jgi:hypothetical protein
MPTIDNIFASLAPANVGIGKAQFDPKLIKGALIVPKGFTITAANLATLQTVLQNAALANGKSARIYPIANFVETKDGSEKVVEQTFGYGAKVVVRDGVYTWSFQFVNGGKTLNDALRTFNGSSWDVFFVDVKNVLMGTAYVDSTGAKGLKAIPLIQLYTQPFALNDGKKLAEYIIDFTFDPKYLNENGHYIADAGFDILDNIQGLQDVALTGVANATSGSYDLTIQTPLGVNLGDQYGNVSGLMQSSAWSITNATTGLVIALAVSTPFAYNSATKVLTIALLKTDPNYPTTGKVSFNLVGPTELATAGIVGFESLGAVQITKN